MRERYHEKINKLTLIGHFCAMICIILGLVSQLKMSDLPTVNSILPIVAEVVVSVGVFIMYVKHRESVAFTRYIAVGFSVVYVAMMLLASSGSAFPYMLPYLLCIILSLYYSVSGYMVGERLLCCFCSGKCDTGGYDPCRGRRGYSGVGIGHGRVDYHDTRDIGVAPWSETPEYVFQ